MDHIATALEAAGNWLKANDQNIDEITVWCLAIGPVVLGLSKFLAVAIMGSQRDRTAVGRALRPQKFTEGVAWLALGGLYSLTLWAFYTETIVDFWWRIALRVVLIVAVVAATVFMLRFDRALVTVSFGNGESRGDGLP